MVFILLLVIVAALSGCGDAPGPLVPIVPKTYREYVERRTGQVCNGYDFSTEKDCRYWMAKLKECEEKKQ